MLPLLLESAQVTADMMRSLAQVLFTFHAHAKQLSPAGAAAHFDTVTKQWRDNLKDVEQLIGNAIDPDDFAAIKAFGDNFLDQNRELIWRRASDGWVRDGHGDLHCEHVCFAPEGIQIFDCVEFDPQTAFVRSRLGDWLFADGLGGSRRRPFGRSVADAISRSHK
jgi:uncharacterized protein